MKIYEALRMNVRIERRVFLNDQFDVCVWA